MYLMAGDLALASYHDLKGKMIMQVNMKKGNGKNSITSKQFNRGLIFQLIATGTCNTRIDLSEEDWPCQNHSDQYCGRVHGEGNCKGM